MALITSHVLNGIDGTHAFGVKVQLLELKKTSAPIFETETDANGRLSQSLGDSAFEDMVCDLVFFTGDYWSHVLIDKKKFSINDQVVVRFRISDPNGHYHMPLILSPNTYCVWMSG